MSASVSTYSRLRLLDITDFLGTGLFRRPRIPNWPSRRMAFEIEKYVLAPLHLRLVPAILV
jgi:hypothetical protein